MPDQICQARLGKIPDFAKHDVARIVRVLARWHIVISEREAWLAWREYSDDRAASWMTLPFRDEALFEAIIPYTEEVPNA